MNAMTAATRTVKVKRGSKRISESSAQDQSGGWIRMPMSESITVGTGRRITLCRATICAKM